MIDPQHVDRSGADASSMYDKLENMILPLFHQHRDGYTDVMRHAIAFNGSFFNSHRMVEEYALKAYAPCPRKIGTLRAGGARRIAVH